MANLANGLGISLFIMIGFFFAMMEEKYRKTFLNVESGKQFTRRKFLDGNDVMKSDVFYFNNKVYWAPIRGKVGAWVRAVHRFDS